MAQHYRSISQAAQYPQQQQQQRYQTTSLRQSQGRKGVQATQQMLQHRSQNNQSALVKSYDSAHIKDNFLLAAESKHD
jgi:hypothetical protein